jgi:glucan 1,3-beta-glucosidase
LRIAAACFVASLALIAAAWWWAGAPVAIPPSPLPAGAKLNCVSYTPFRHGQSPLDPDAYASPAQIDADLTRLSAITDCVRIYAVDQGLDQVPAIAARHGLSVILGIWIGREPAKNALQIARGIALANAYPKTVRLIVVGNEALLRGEISADALGAILRTVRAETKVPITYADVWEFWLRNAQLARDVDVVTIHILPYWEDDPVAAADAAAHVATIYRQVTGLFPGKPILIGETGWPSEGRMRGPARPTPANQARVLTDIVQWARSAGVRINYIEAFDQPWKRNLEGTAGGYWGLLDADHRTYKFSWGEPVSNHPDWPWRMLGGWAFAAALFGATAFARRRADRPMPGWLWPALGAVAAIGGVGLGLAAEYWMLGVRNLAEDAEAAVALAIALLMPVGAAALLARGKAPVGMIALLSWRPAARRLGWWVGLLSAALAVESLQLALALVFDPRYRGFPASSLAGPLAALVLLAARHWQGVAAGGLAERVFALALAASAVVIVVQEGMANFEALAFVACLVILAGTLAVAPRAQGPTAGG